MAPALPAAPRGLRVWCMTTGEAGTRQQARGLATALAADAEERLIRVSRIWALAPPILVGVSPPAVTPLAGRLEPPWPDVLVSCGRRSALVAMAIARRNPAPMVCVHIQPPAHPRAFDLVVAMPHDRLRGDNVVTVDTALHGVSPAVLAQARDDTRFEGLPRPWTGVLLGGSTGHRDFTLADTVVLADQLDALRRCAGGSLLITPSRRTPAVAVAALGARYGTDPSVRIWDGASPNPYLPILALADRLVVTSDSVSMISEALATAAPVSILRLPSGRRHVNFVDNLIGKGLVAPLGAPPSDRPRPPLDATPAVAAIVRRLWAEKLGGRAANDEGRTRDRV